MKRNFTAPDVALGGLAAFRRLSQPAPKTTQGSVNCVVHEPSAAIGNSAQRVRDVTVEAPVGVVPCGFTSTLDIALPTYCSTIADTTPPVGVMTWKVTRPLKSLPPGNIAFPKPP